MLIIFFDLWENRIASKGPFKVPCAIVSLRLRDKLGLVIPSHALRLLLKSNRLETIHLVYRVFQSLFFGCAKWRCSKTFFGKVKYLVSYEKIFWSPVYFCEKEEMYQVLLGYSVNATARRVWINIYASEQVRNKSAKQSWPAAGSSSLSSTRLWPQHFPAPTVHCTDVTIVPKIWVTITERLARGKCCRGKKLSDEAGRAYSAHIQQQGCIE